MKVVSLVESQHSSLVSSPFSSPGSVQGKNLSDLL
ncbi:hypothetical protein LEMLEM_LOCUS9708 [Lemmus lemmus]